MAPHISARLRRLVVRRARNRCEYCGLSQLGQEATFHIDHIVPVNAGGPDTADNLALACVSCSLRKAARQTAIDPTSGERVALFHPRRDLWHDHFRWQGMYLMGRTATGRATIEALEMNRPLIIAIREEEAPAVDSGKNLENRTPDVRISRWQCGSSRGSGTGRCFRDCWNGTQWSAF